MREHDAHRLGYRRVDDDPNVAVLVDTMDATGRWDAIVELRAWERRRLRLAVGESLLDVGCGLGDAAVSLAEDVGHDGRVVGIDASSSMLMVARQRAETAGRPVRFSLGDAVALDEPDRSFDAVRSERTLQWLIDPAAAVCELMRVVKPGGRVSLIDTDWSTLSIDVGDAEISTQVRAAMSVERRRASNVGSRLGGLARGAGLDVVDATSRTQQWTEWDPDASPAPDGCFSMRSLAYDLAATGQIDSADTRRFVSVIHDAARCGRFGMSLTMFAVLATAPPPGPS